MHFFFVRFYEINCTISFRNSSITSCKYRSIYIKYYIIADINGYRYPKKTIIKFNFNLFCYSL